MKKICFSREELLIPIFLIIGLILISAGLLIHGKDAFLPFLAIERPHIIPKLDAIIFGIGGILLIFGVLSFVINRLVQKRTDQQLDKVEEDLQIIHDRMDSLGDLFTAVEELSETIEIMDKKIKSQGDKDSK